MTQADRRDETSHERARRDPKRFQHDWLRATEEGTGQDTLEGAIEVATGGEPRVIDDPVVNGYHGINTSPTEPPGPPTRPDAGAHPH